MASEEPGQPSEERRRASIRHLDQCKSLLGGHLLQLLLTSNPLVTQQQK